MLNIFLGTALVVELHCCISLVSHLKKLVKVKKILRMKKKIKISIFVSIHFTVLIILYYSYNTKILNLKILAKIKNICSLI